MTNDNNTRTKANAVFFSVLMVISMVAVGFAAAPAAADATTIDSTDAEDVSIEQSSVTQDVSFNVTLDDGTNDTIEIDLSAADTAGVSPSVDSVSVENTSEFTVNESSLSGTTHSFNLTDEGNSGSVDEAVVTVTYDHDTTGVDPDTGVNFDISAASGSGSATATFDLTAPNNRITGSDTVFNNTDVFQGEDGLTFIDDNGDELSASDLEGTSGAREGSPLQLPIPTDAERGVYAENGAAYSNDAFAVTVIEPRITTSEVQLSGNDVSQVGTERASELDIFAEWNFGDAEELAVSVEDPSGDEITNEVLDGGDDVLTYGEGGESGDAASVGLDLSGEDAGDYTVIFEGNDDLDQDSVVQEYTIETTSQNTVSLETAEDTVTQGDNLQYTISGATNADVHTVTIDADDLRDNADIDDALGVFRNVQDVVDRGAYDTSSGGNDLTSTDSIDDADYVYATVEIDGTSGVGAIETASLDDTSVDLEVFEAGGGLNTTDDESLDDVSFDVTEGDVSLDSPTDTYTVGSEVDINGTAQSADEVVIFARDNSDWEPLDIDESGDFDLNDDTISVESDDSFEEEDVALSQANNIYSFEGSYDIGVVDASDLNSENFDNEQLTTSQFATASSARYTLDVQAGDLTANFGTINGQIASVDSQIDVDGTAAGQDEVVVAFVGQRGDTVTEVVSVDSDDEFDREDISLEALSQGTASGHVISAGRDTQFGDGGSGYESADDLATTIDNFGSGQSSGDQIRSQILANTVDETGGDDLIVSSTFRLNDATLSVNNVYPEAAEAQGLNPVATGETMVIEGDTNRQPDNAAITFELLTQEDESVASASTDEWESDGQFSATIDTSDLETGTYILEADDGESTDRVNVEIVEERQQPDDGDDGSTDGDDGSTDGDDGSTDGDDGSTDGDDGSTDGDDGSTDGDDGGSDGDDGGDGGTDDSTPGFGALVALVALIAAALLATRRND